jgi:hypothetical protein
MHSRTPRSSQSKVHHDIKTRTGGCTSYTLVEASSNLLVSQGRERGSEMNCPCDVCVAKGGISRSSREIARFLEVDHLAIGS